MSFSPPTHREPQPPPTYGSFIQAVLLGTMPSAKTLTHRWLAETAFVGLARPEGEDVVAIRMYALG
ncbi:hypothetical protein GCM10023323_25270 [Streptomyces thinghirensis]|uniref:Uncharacterized protein n=1 Tax=Streptomyces thinghirensis TaxID=551547 RepID=A0ABP9T3J2_9ACTN